MRRQFLAHCRLAKNAVPRGFALPHTRVEGLARFFGIFARLNQLIYFDSIDGNPVDLVFLLLIPAAGGEHLAALAAISRNLRDKEFAAKLRKAANTAALCNLLCDPRASSFCSRMPRSARLST